MAYNEREVDTNQMEERGGDLVLLPRSDKREKANGCNILKIKKEIPARRHRRRPDVTCGQSGTRP